MGKRQILDSISIEHQWWPRVALLCDDNGPCRTSRMLLFNLHYTLLHACVSMQREVNMGAYWWNIHKEKFMFDTLCYTKLMAVIIIIRIGDRIDNNSAAQWEYNTPVAQIPQYIGPIYHNASFLADICTRVHISATKGCIVGYSVDYGISEVGLFDEQNKKRHSSSSCLALVKCTSWYPLANTLNWQSNNG